MDGHSHGRAAELAAVTKLRGAWSGILNKVAYLGVAIDVWSSTIQNIANNASQDKIIWDITIDVAVTGGSIFASGKAGAAVGTAIGGLPGTIVGGAVGLIGSGVLYWFTDCMEIRGKSIRHHLKGLIS